jgi:uncharacterized protein (UPF0276 family)
VALHGVSLSIAGSEPLVRGSLDGLAALAAWLEPVFVSDHLCWTALGGHESHDMLPVACTREVLEHVAARVAHVQDRLKRRLLLENASAYVAFCAREMEEADFLAELARRTGCGVLLDVNNLVVNAANLGSDPKRARAPCPWTPSATCTSPATPCSKTCASTRTTRRCPPRCGACSKPRCSASRGPA